MKTSSNLILILLLILLALISCCPGMPWCPPEEPPEPPFGFKEVNFDTSSAMVGELIRFDWQYHRPGELKNQWIEQVSLMLQGTIWRLTQGCSPDIPDNPCMDRNIRASSFVFPGPLTVIIGAESQNGKIIKATFDVILHESAFFKARIIIES